MRHRSSRLRLNSKPDHAALLQRNLITSLLLYESIRTTKKRARVIQPLVDRLITVAKTKETPIAIRSINKVVTDKNASKKLLEVLKERYTSRDSGFTRLQPVGARKGDGAELVDLTLVDAVIGGTISQKKEEKPKNAATAKKAQKTPQSSESSSATSSSSSESSK